MESKDLYLCFDIGGTNVKYGVISSGGTFYTRGKYPTNCIDLTQFIEDIVQVINELETKFELQGIGISLPGYINPESGYAEMAGAIEALHGQNLKQLIKDKKNIKVEIENDANCVALAEKFNGNAMECNDFICLTIGTGIGGGIFVNGQIVHGYSFKAGEFGMMIMNDFGAEYLNMHDLASTKALIKLYRNYKGIDEEEHIEGITVFEEAEKDPEVKAIIDTWYKRLSYGIFNLASVLNPEKILIGGAISVRDDLYAELHKKLAEIDVWEDISVKIEPCEHRNDAGMLGALYKLVN